MASYADAISGIESSGRYDLVGPTHPKYGRALGKYQVMEANVGPWTQQYLGQRMTPDQFLASPEAQDAVFQGEFGRLAGKHGPEGAARAWFAGEGGMNDPTRKDSLGTSVADYARKFNAAYGAGGEPQAAAPMQIAPDMASAPAASPGAPMGLLPQQAQANPMQGLLAGLMGGGQQGGPGGLLGGMAGQQQAPQKSLLDQADPVPPMIRRPVDLARLQAVLQQPGIGRGLSWS
jgi:hypothetical protein